MKSGGETLRAAVERYLKDTVLSHKSFLKYRNALNEFVDFAGVSHIEAVKREDIIAFMRHLEREKSLNGKTATDKGVIVLSFARKHGAKVKMEASGWPRTTERQPRLYQQKPMKKLFEGGGRGGI
ncbi:site-specific integrase [Acidobacterium sp. S8]|uniref:site-specific integrase n=1 Tax=Acidobacterium sp. S8 TaxID=1641854 RepID=UPI0020B12B27|nr:site-specific integrase [Acidobacterium sp. S8]